MTGIILFALFKRMEKEIGYNDLHFSASALRLADDANPACPVPAYDLLSCDSPIGSSASAPMRDSVRKIISLPNTHQQKS